MISMRPASAAQPHFHSVDDYIALQPLPAQTILERVRTTIRKALPKAEEVISYNIPTYKVNGEPVIYFAGWKRHFSLYPISKRTAFEFQSELAQYQLNKSTVRFPLSEPVPIKLIASIAKFRAKEIADRLRAKTQT